MAGPADDHTSQYLDLAALKMGFCVSQNWDDAQNDLARGSVEASAGLETYLIVSADALRRAAAWTARATFE
jgi:hypothetical protein